MKKTLLKTSFAAVALLCGSLTASAAYQEVKAWDFAALYAQLGNKSGVTYETETRTISGTGCNIGTGNYEGLAFQGADKWFLYSSGGLYNGNSGGRKMGILELKAEDKVIVTSVSASTVSLSANGTLESTNGNVQTYKVTADGDFGLSLARNGTIISITVQRNEVEEGEVYCDYTINYTFDNETVKTDTGNELAGTVVNAQAPFTVEGQKYYFADGATTSFTLVANETNVFEVAMRKANVYTYTVKNNVNDDVKTGEGVEGETVYVPYNHYILKNGVLYKKDQTNKEFRYSFVATADVETTLNYTATTTENVIYLSEGEDIDGMTATSANNVDARCSNAAAGYASDPVEFYTLQPGVYKVALGVLGNAGNTFIVKAGETEVMTAATAGYWFESTSEEFTVKAETALTFEGANNSKPLDYVYIQKTGDYTPAEVTYQLQYWAKEYLGGSKFDEEDIIKTEVVKGIEGEPVVITEAEKENITIMSEDGTKSRVYSYVSDDAEGKVIEQGLVIKLQYTYNVAAGVENVAVDAADNAKWYNLQGIEVAEPTQPGLYIHNGKKVIIK